MERHFDLNANADRWVVDDSDNEHGCRYGRSVDLIHLRWRHALMPHRICVQVRHICFKTDGLRDIRYRLIESEILIADLMRYVGQSTRNVD